VSLPQAQRQTTHAVSSISPKSIPLATLQFQHKHSLPLFKIYRTNSKPLRYFVFCLTPPTWLFFTSSHLFPLSTHPSPESPIFLTPPTWLFFTSSHLFPLSTHPSPESPIFLLPAATSFPSPPHPSRRSTP